MACVFDNRDILEMVSEGLETLKQLTLHFSLSHIHFSKIQYLYRSHKDNPVIVETIQEIIRQINLFEGNTTKPFNLEPVQPSKKSDLFNILN